MNITEIYSTHITDPVIILTLQVSCTTQQILTQTVEYVTINAKVMGLIPMNA